MNNYKDNIFLDDEREPWSIDWMGFDYSKISWRIVRDDESFKSAIIDHFPKTISFDNDLGMGKEGYYDCLKWLFDYIMDNNLSLPELYFHSKNTVAEDNMKAYVASFKKINGKKE